MLKCQDPTTAGILKALILRVEFVIVTAMNMIQMQLWMRRWLLVCCAFFAVVCFRGLIGQSSSFAVPKQMGSYFMRQKEGLGAYTTAGEEFNSIVNASGLVLEPTKQEKKLASFLKHAGNSKKGPQEWRKLYAKYAGNSPLVLTAAMQAALKQRDYQ